MEFPKSEKWTGLFAVVGFLSLLSTVASVGPPENVSLSWQDGLYPKLSWAHPRDFDQNCCFVVTLVMGERKFTEWSPCLDSLWWMPRRILNGGLLHMSVQTCCDKPECQSGAASAQFSEAASVQLNDTNLKLNCVIKSSTLTRCTWKPHPFAKVNFFYNLMFPEDDSYGERPLELQECPLYHSSGTGCDLQVAAKHELKVLLNGTHGNTTIRNVFQFPSVHLSLPGLVWTVVKKKDQFVIEWSAPEFDKLSWKYFIRSTACDLTSLDETTNRRLELKRDATCPYSISLRGEVGNSGGTEWITQKFDPDSDFDPMLFAAVLVPLAVAGIMILGLLWWRRNKDKLFPRVPEPKPELFTDLMNNKLQAANFSFPKEEEEECQVTLVVDLIEPEL